jgi:hypothetical protein
VSAFSSTASHHKNAPTTSSMRATLHSETIML